MIAIQNKKENNLKGVPCDLRNKNKFKPMNLIIVNLSYTTKKALWKI